MRSFDFGWALDSVKVGKRCMRSSWPSGVYIAVQLPDTGSKMTVPYLYIRTLDNKLSPYAPTQDDIFGADWDCV